MIVAKKFQKNRLSMIATLIVLGIVIYANSLFGQFQFDDYPVVVNNPVIQNDNLITLWRSVHHPTRFIAYCSFALNYHSHGLSPMGFHVVNIGIHLVNAILVLWMIELLFQSPYLARRNEAGISASIAGICALMFLVHPIQTESVAYITQRFTSLASLFYLFSICLYIKGRLLDSFSKNQIVYFIGCIMCMLLGMFTKQITITLPIIIVLIECSFFQHKSKTKYKLWMLFILAFILLVPALYSFDVKGILAITHESGSHRGDLITGRSYLLTQPRVIFTYLKLLMFPLNQNLLYDFKISYSLYEIKTLLSWIGLVTAVIVSLLIYAKNRFVGLGLCWFWITLSVESSIIPIKHLIFEHRLYLPSVGFFICVTYLLVRILKNKRWRYGVTGVIVCLLCVLTVQRNKIWSNGILMWEDVVKKSPHQARSHYNLGYEYMKQGEADSALSAFTKALDIDPDYYDAYNNRSQVYYDKGLFKEAFLDINNAIRVDNQRAEAYLNRGAILRQMQRFDMARKDFTQAIKLDLDNSVAFLNRGLTLGNLGKYDQAIKDLDRAVELNTDFAQAYNVRGALYLAKNKRNKALKDFDAAIRSDPRLIEAYRNRAFLLQANGQFDLALEDLNRIIERKPEDLDAYSRRAYVYNKLNMLDSALEDFTHILARQPQMSKIYLEKGKIYYRRNQYKRAADEFSLGLSRDPQDALGYLFRGFCYFELRDYNKALEDMNKAKELGQPVDDAYFERLHRAINQI